MKENTMLMCLICFVLGYLVARMMRGNGLSVGVQTTQTPQISNSCKTKIEEVCGIEKDPLIDRCQICISNNADSFLQNGCSQDEVTNYFTDECNRRAIQAPVIQPCMYTNDCLLGQGLCVDDSDCDGTLVCGENNCDGAESCGSGNSHKCSSTDNCCVYPTCEVTESSGECTTTPCNCPENTTMRYSKTTNGERCWTCGKGYGEHSILDDIPSMNDVETDFKTDVNVLKGNTPDTHGQ